MPKHLVICFQIFKDETLMLAEQGLTSADQLSPNDRAALCECEASCSDTKFSAATTFAPLSKSAKWNSYANYSNATYNYANYSYAKDNLAIIHIFYSRQSFMAMQRNQDYTTMDFLASVGGLLGLTVGISATTVVEICYYFCLRPFIKSFGRKVIQ
jgi:hypothetical protein